ncbi:hypothetical protein D8B25_20440, partial [Verminephrobacter aporrectodeae subsp. tuberculatae]|nr:hypothetical protein [Verminephrobacter aporrectodeae subsp. tuberculatae]MCW8171528.1 hypothetical protein [Verminephrobacter aporrectodeae subsp. tuberculatae]MCW8177642.1 hypothetical protein [Verminephrobacter aporrectodeae subsp. tuberculatae]
MQRLGRLKQRFARAAQHYEISVTTDPKDQRITAITWDKRTKPGSAAAHPGVYCLRTTLRPNGPAQPERTAQSGQEHPARQERRNRQRPASDSHWRQRPCD